jgi:hypothetical protein
MNQQVRTIAELDHVIHEPGRLMIGPSYPPSINPTSPICNTLVNSWDGMSKFVIFTILGW